MNPTDEEYSFTEISIPLPLPSLPQQIPSDDSVPSSSSLNFESHPEDDCSHESFEIPHCSNESCNANELELDSMWNEVYDNLIAQTDERELRDWEMTMTQEDDGDYEEVSEEITLAETDDPLLEVEMDSDDQIRCESSGQTNAGKTFSENQMLYSGASGSL